MGLNFMLLDHKPSNIERVSASKPGIAIFVMPATSKAWVGAEGLWVTVAGWAEAAKRRLGNSVVVTQDRIAAADEVLDYPLVSKNEKHQNSRRFAGIPSIIKIVYKDIIEWKQSWNWKIFASLDYQKEEVAFVWEKHDLFSGSGLKLAQKYEVPYISYVHAPVVWEAEKWGVKRFSWGQFLERREAAVLKKADVVAVVSKEVKAKLIQLGVQKEKILVSPMAVDPELYNVPRQDTDRLKEKLGLKEKFTIGWTGSFRGFHGLEQIINAFQKVVKNNPNTVLILVGEGKERTGIESLVNSLGIRQNVIFTGRIPYREIPLYLSVFDLAVAGAKTAVNFHYSPQKIRDYMAAGVPVLAPDAGEVSYIFQNQVHLRLFKVGEVNNIKEHMLFFLNNREERQKIGEAGKQFVLSNGTWDYEVDKCLEFLKSKK